jgi:hypothetical protein
MSKSFYFAVISIPDAIWGAVVGMLGALFVAWINNRFQKERLSDQHQHDVGKLVQQQKHDIEKLNQQHRHDIEQKQEEREKAVRKEVYLEAAKEYANAANFLSKFSHIDFPAEEQQALIKDYDAAIGKLHLIGSEDTLKKLAATNQFFVAASLHLWGLKWRIVDIKKHIQVLDERIKRNAGIQQQIADTFAQMSQEQLNSGSPQIQKLSETLREREEDSKASLESINGLDSQLRQEHKAICLAAQTKTAEFGELLIEAVITVRNDLGIPITNPGDYRSTMTRMREAVKDEMHSYLENAFKDVPVH